MIVPLMVACFLAHATTVLALKRSILTEKIARRGFHLSREYSMDPLEILLAKETMRTSLIAFSADHSLDDARHLMNTSHRQHGQHLYPVVDDQNRLAGVLSRKILAKLLSSDAHEKSPQSIREHMNSEPVMAYPDEPLRIVVSRMADKGLTRFPVVDRSPDRKLLGMISLEDLLRARTRALSEERDRERVLRIRLPFQAKSRREADVIR